MKKKLIALFLLAALLLACAIARAATLTLPAKMTAIPAQAFMNDSSLDRVKLPEGLTSIGAQAFAFSSVQRVDLPSTVQQIADNAFDGCENMYVTAKKGTFAHQWAKENGLLVVITEQPKDTFVGVGKPLSISVTAKGKGLTYCWQYCPKDDDTWYNSNMTGCKTATQSYEEAARGWDGQRYRCIITDSDGVSAVTEEATIYVVEPPVILSQPEDTVAAIDSDFTFFANAEGTGITYRWQVKPSGSTKWENTKWTGYNSSLLKGGPATKSMNGYSFRCKMTDACGNTVTTNAATLTVADLRITQQPQNIKVGEGKPFSFSVTAEGEGLTYVWQSLSKNGAGWAFSLLDGAATDTLSSNSAKTNWNGFYYRCIVTDKNGNSVYTEPGILRVAAKPVITMQPADQAVTPGSPYSFSVVASGQGLTYQWTRSKPGGIGWNYPLQTGATTDTISGDSAPASQNGYLFRCTVTDKYGNFVQSDIATLYVGTFGIAKQPQDLAVGEGKPISFSVTAVGEGLTYKWQYFPKNGTEWADAKLTGSNTATMSNGAATMIWDGYRYRCVVTNSGGDVAISKPVTLTVVPNPVITEQPESVKISAGKKVIFRVTATGTGLSYQWQVSTDGGDTWANMGNISSNTCSFTSMSGMKGNHYRCVVTDQYGNNAISTGAVLNIQEETKYRALLIGETRFYTYNGITGEYENENATRNSKSVSLVQEMLSGVRGPGGGKYTVTTGINKGYSEIKSLIKSTFQDTTENDVSLFMIATHGNAATKKNGHIIARNDGDLWMPFMGTVDEMNIESYRDNYWWKGSDGTVYSHTEHLPFSTLASWLKTYVKGEVIIMINSCGSGASIYETDLEQNAIPGGAAANDGIDPDAWVERAISAFAAADPGIEKESDGPVPNSTGDLRVLNKFYVLASSRYGENSYGDNELGSFFYRNLVAGVGSKGDCPADSEGNNNGTVDLAELFRYIKKFDAQDSRYNDWYKEYILHVQRYPASGTGSTYPLFTFQQ